LSLLQANDYDHSYLMSNKIAAVIIIINPFVLLLSAEVHTYFYWLFYYTQLNRNWITRSRS